MLDTVILGVALALAIVVAASSVILTNMSEVAVEQDLCLMQMTRFRKEVTGYGDPEHGSVPLMAVDILKTQQGVFHALVVKHELGNTNMVVVLWPIIAVV